MGVYLRATMSNMDATDSQSDICIAKVMENLFICSTTTCAIVVQVCIVQSTHKHFYAYFCRNIQNIQYRPVTTAHMCVIFRIVSHAFAIVIHAKLKLWSMTMSDLNPRMV